MRISDWSSVVCSSDLSLNTLTDNFTAAFAEGDVYITERIAAKLGVRFEYSYLLEKASVAPRLSLAYRIKKGKQVNLAYGLLGRKSVVWGKSVPVRVAFGGRRLITTKRKKHNRS